VDGTDITSDSVVNDTLRGIGGEGINVPPSVARNPLSRDAITFN
jgi:hypothetical protein